MTMQWYVLRSKPNKEDALYKQVMLRGFETFYPRQTFRPVNPRARKTVPCFASYMFVHIDLQETGLSTFQWMPYAIGLVSFDGEPAIIPDDLMHSLCKSIEALTKKPEYGRLDFQPGHMLTVSGGPFAGYEAVFDASLPGHERIRILLNLARGKQVLVELPAAYVQKKI